VQTKLFAGAERAGLAAGARNIATITNDEQRKGNFHNIHAKGRIFSDVVLADHYDSGFVAVLCVDNTDYAIPVTMTPSILEDMQGIVVAAEQWSTFSGATARDGAATFYPFDFYIKASRTCPMKGRLLLVIWNDSASDLVIVTDLISTNITQA